ncbi:hypothetical protein AJ78_00712 [Emergomyces pasteurianus Ep9510]|uniref:Mid2 domain-containing protein n=1 Tax=Emergomyces pasteurianus Ep9510 TaxID=1447872 RepID=A0A1J9PSV7_9EURO|nr:hypothetical protein AJ78_00712 [Emergomyces pasteurianus Ep9510]
MWYLLCFVVAANAVAFTTPSATIPTQNAPFAIPEPTKLPLKNDPAHKLVRRATTQQAEASICGYYAGSKQSRLACYNNNACVFHSSNANFPAMVGCCPTVSTTTPCTFISTCYGSSQLAATSSLRAFSNDPFVMLCTGDENPLCHTRTWPGFSVADYQCTYSGTGTSSGAETMFTVGSLTDVKNDADQYTETMSISWIDDSVLLAIRGASATLTPGTTATSTTTSPGNKAGPTEDDNDSKGSGSKPNTTTIVGAAVGGGGGFIVLVVVVVFIWRAKREPRVETKAVPDKVESQPIKPFDGDEEPMIHEMHGIEARRRYELMPERNYVELPTPEVRHQLE